MSFENVEINRSSVKTFRYYFLCRIW